MSHIIEALLARMRSAAVERGPGWLEEQVRAAMPGLSPPVDAGEPRRAARRSRPPERLSPDATPRVRRRRRSPRRDPPAPAVVHSPRSRRGAGRNPLLQSPAAEGVAAASAPPPDVQRLVGRSLASPPAGLGGGSVLTPQRSAGPRRGGAGGRARPSRSGREARPACDDVRSWDETSGARREGDGRPRRPCSARFSAGPDDSLEPVGSVVLPVSAGVGRSRASRTVSDVPPQTGRAVEASMQDVTRGAGEGRPVPPRAVCTPAGEPDVAWSQRQEEVAASSPLGEEVQPAASPEPPMRFAAAHSPDVSDGGSLDDSDGVATATSPSPDTPSVAPQRRHGSGYVGPGPIAQSVLSRHPVRRSSSSREQMSTATGEQPQERSGESTTTLVRGAVGGGMDLEGVQFFLKGIQDLLSSGRGLGSPVGAWGAQAPAPCASVVISPTPELPAADGALPQVPPNVPGVVAAGSGEEVRMADSARGEVYVCFEGPLGAHLKSEVRDRIWRGEYVEIFSLLPLEKFNLDRVRQDESKKEEEERRRYRLIPRTFSNWLQAFVIMASVIGEKAPEHCSALF